MDSSFPTETFREAAVLIPLILQNETPHILLTQRSETVAHHKGQICFPGGTRDADDTDLLATALRETEEEIGLQRTDFDLLGSLAWEITPARFKIRPFVALLPSFDAASLRFAPAEIANCFLVPLPELCDPQKFWIESRAFAGRNIPVPFFQYEDRLIWGATGRMIVNLLCALQLSPFHQNLNLAVV